MNDSAANLLFEPKLLSLLKSVAQQQQQHQMLQEFHDNNVDIKNSPSSSASSPTPLLNNNTNIINNNHDKNIALFLALQQQQRQNPINVLPQIAINLPPFVPMHPVYAPSGYGRQILIYDSRAYPGRRREFAYKTRFTNQSGFTTVYYRCMACRALRHRLQRVMPKQQLPAVPCIAVKNEMLINDPDFPEASNHFCTPLTIEESNERLKVTFERGYKRARMKMATEDSAKLPAFLNNSLTSVTCEGESNTNSVNINQFMWTKKNEFNLGNDIKKEEEINFKEDVKIDNNVFNENDCNIVDVDGCGENASTANDICSNMASASTEFKQEISGESDIVGTGDEESTLNDSNCSTTPTICNIENNSRTNRSPRKRQRLDNLLRLQEQRQLLQQQRDKSTSPDENINITGFAQKLLERSNISPPSFLNHFNNNNNVSLLSGPSTPTMNSSGFEATTFSEITGNITNLFNSSSNTLNSALHNNANDHYSRLNSYTTTNTNNTVFTLQQALASKLRSNVTNGSSELLRALTGPQTASKTSYTTNLNAYNSIAQNEHLSEILAKYIKNNWDLPENGGNSRSAAELTCSLILALSRNVAQAAASMKEGKWARKDFMGEEVYGKTLAIIGLGRIGQEVANRMQSFGMKIVGYDPLVTSEDASKRKIKWLSLEEIWPIADYITVHVPLINQTRNLLCLSVFMKCKRGVRIINVARGGIVNEDDLYNALESGQVGGAALDVFVKEPPESRSLIEHPKVICTPHLGASTLEAQQRVAVEIAENFIALNNGVGLYGSINANALSAVLDESKAQYIKAAAHLAQILSTIAPGSKNVIIKCPSSADGMQKALSAAVLVGLLKANGTAGLNLVNAEVNAIKEGISVKVEKAPIGSSEITVTDGGSNSVSGYSSPSGTLITSINDGKVPFAVLAAGNLAIAKNESFKTFSNNAKFASKMAVEFNLFGGGHLALFDESLSLDEIKEICNENYVIVRFCENSKDVNGNTTQTETS